MALAKYERYIVEKIRESAFVKVIVNEGTKDEMILKVGGNCPHDIALAVQTHFNEEARRWMR